MLMHNIEAQLAAVQRLQHLPGVHTHTLLRCASMPHATPCGTVLAAVYEAALAVELQSAEPDIAIVAAVCTRATMCPVVVCYIGICPHRWPGTRQSVLRRMRSS